MARNRYDVDEVLEDSFDINQLKRLAGYIKPYKKQMIFVVILMLSSSALTMLIPTFMQRIKSMLSVDFYRLFHTPLFYIFLV